MATHRFLTRPTRSRTLRRRFQPEMEWLEARLAPATLQWDGDVDENWNTNLGGNTNWDTNTLPMNGDVLCFDQFTGRFVTTNNVPNLSLAEIRFESSPTSHRLIGNPLTLTGNINVQVGAGSPRIDLNLTIAPNQMMFVDAGASLDLAGALGGAGSLTKTGSGTLTFSGTGANTYTDLTFVNEGTLELGKDPNVIPNAAIPNTLVIGNSIGAAESAVVKLLLNSQIPNTALVGVNADGRFDLNNKIEILGPLSMNTGIVVIGTGTMTANGFVQMAGGIIDSTGAGKLVLGDNLSATSSGSNPAIILGTLSLGGATRTLGVFEGPATLDLVITATIEDGGAAAGIVVDAAGGVVEFEGNNTYTGLTTINPAAILVITSPTALGSTAGGTTLLAGGLLRLMGNLAVGNEALTLNGSSLGAGFGANSWTGPITLAGDGTIFLNLPADTFILSGSISGPGGLIKDNVGRLIYSGVQTFNYLGTTLVREGELVLDNAGPDNTTIRGPLIIGDGVGAANSASVRLFGDHRIGDGTPVTVNSDGKFEAEDHDEFFGPLTINDGNVSLGAGLLGVNGLITMTGGVITTTGVGLLGVLDQVQTNAAANEATINGTVELFGATRTFTVADGAAVFDLFIAGEIRNGGVTKTGPGTLTFGGALANTYTGTTTVREGKLRLVNTGQVNTAILGPLVIGDGVGNANSAVVQLDQSDEINDTAAVTVNADGLLSIVGSFRDTIGPLTINDGNIQIGTDLLQVNGPLTMTGGNVTATGPSGTLRLGGDVTATSSAIGEATFANGRVDLVGVTRTFTVSDGTFSPDLSIFAVIQSGGGDAGLIKAGLGELRLGVANEYTGTTSINAGTLVVAANDALGTTAAGTTVAAGATLGFQGTPFTGFSYTTAEPVTLNGLGVGGTDGAIRNINPPFGNLFAGPITLASASSIVNVGGLFVLTGACTLNANLTLDGTSAGQVSGTVTGPGGVTKNGSGLWRLEGNNDYAGTTTINAGNLLVTGAQAGSAVTVNAGGTLGGSGTLGPVTMAGGTLAPGTSPGTLNTGIFSLNAAAIFQAELNGASAGSFDQLNVTGSVSLAGVLTALAGFTPTAGTVFTLIQNDGADPINGTFNNLPQGANVTLDGVPFQLTYAGGTGNDVALSTFPAITINDMAISEGDTGTVNLVFTVSLSTVTPHPVTVQVATADGSATAPADYTALATTTLNFAPGGPTSLPVTVVLNGDMVLEGNHGFVVNLTNAVNATIADAQGVGTILDDEVAQPGQFQFNDAAFSVNETDGMVTFTVSRTNGSDGTVMVNYATSNGSAEAGSDYTSASGTLTFNNGETSKMFTVTILDDAAIEANETVNLTLSAPAGGATLGGQSTAVLTITDNETAQPGQLQFSLAAYTMNENASTATITVSRTNGSDGTVMVNYATSNGNATVGADYTSASGTLTFNNGETSKTFDIPILDDAVLEGNETVNLTLSAPTGGATLGGQSTAVLTITDNETAQPGQLQFNMAAFSANETGGSAMITVTRTNGGDGTVTVDFVTSNGTATAGVDYTTAAGTLTFATGETTKMFTITVLDDVRSERNETVDLTLSNATGGAALGTPSTASLTIADNELPAGPGKFTDQNGDTYTVKLTGGGTVGVILADPDGDGRGPIDLLTLQGANPAKSSLSVTVKKAASDDGRVSIGEIRGPALKSIAAKASDLVGSGINLDGFLGGLTIRDLLNGADIIAGGTAAQKTKITAHDLGDGTTIDIDSAISTLLAARFGDGAIIAPSIGSLQIKGDAKLGLAGDFRADVTLTGGGTALNTAKIAGMVQGSTITVAGGNVNAFHAGAFLDSTLFVGFAPTDGMNPMNGGTFAPGLQINSFKVTGSTTPAFRNSTIAASRVNKVSLSSVATDNGGTKFGVLADDAIGGVTVTTPAFRFDSTQPTPQGIGDFQVKVV